MPSKSRKVNGYVSAVLRREKLAEKVDAATAAFNERMRPLRAKYDAAKVEVAERRGSLTGGQLAEAQRALATDHRLGVAV